MYNKIVLDHFQNPRNLTSLPNPDGYGVGANPTCGDVLKLYLKVENDTITKATFKTMGCGAAIASGSPYDRKVGWQKNIGCGKMETQGFGGLAGRTSGD